MPAAIYSFNVLFDLRILHDVHKAPTADVMVSRSVDSCRSAFSQIGVGWREFTPSIIPRESNESKVPIALVYQFYNAKFKATWTGV